jgi:hypothetical protein
MKGLCVLALGVVLLGVASPGSATSITYEYVTTATDGGPGAGIIYTLKVDTVTKAATFTIDGSSSAVDVWRADWFTFKWSDNTNYQLTNLVAPSGSWGIADYDTNSTVKVLNGGTFSPLLEAYRSGFYLTSIANGSNNPTAPGSVCLAPGSGSLSCTVALPKTFTFNIGVPLNYSVDEIPFKVGYYDGVTGSKKNVQFVTNKLSRALDEVVPVPDNGSTVGLLGLGLLALGVARKLLSA